MKNPPDLHVKMVSRSIEESQELRGVKISVWFIHKHLYVERGTFI